MTKRELILEMIEYLDTHNSGGLCVAFAYVMKIDMGCTNDMLKVLPEIRKYKPVNHGQFWFGNNTNPITATNGKQFFGNEARLRLLVELLGEMTEEQLNVLV